MRTRTFAAGMAGSLAVLGSLAAQTPGGSLLRADFEDGQRTGWYLTSGGEASVADDQAGIGSGHALFMTVSGGSTQRRLVANFEPVELSNVNDTIVLRFDFRITGPRDTNADGGFRFGLFDSRGTRQTSDATSGASSATASDDVGYLAMISVGIRNRARLVEERGEDPHLMGGTDLRFLQTDDNFGGIDDALKHTAVFTITRVSTGSLGLELLVDGKKSIKAEISENLWTRFSEVGIAGTNNSCSFAIDNVTVTRSAASTQQ